MSRIGVVTSSLDKPFLTGPGVYLDNMLNALAELPGALDQVVLIHYRPSLNPIYGKIPDLMVPRLPFISELCLRQQGLNVIHYNHLPTYRPFGMIPARKVLTLHGLGNFVSPRSFPFHVRFARSFIWPTLIRLFDQIIAVSKFTRQLAIRHWNVSPERIHTVYHGIAPHFRMQNEQDIVEQQSAIGAPYILHVSNYAPKKNVETLIRAFLAIKRRGFPHKLVIVGGRWENSSLLALIASLGLEENVVFKPYVANSTLPIWYAAADLYVTLSLHESFCFPVAEAMACGCPVIVSNRTALPEIVGDAGLLIDNPTSVVDVADAICNVLENVTLAEDMRAAGLARARIFSWRKNAEKTLEIYQNLL